MSIESVPGVYFQAVISGLDPGLYGTLTAAIYQGADVVTAPHVTGIVEQPAGTYTATLLAPVTPGTYNVSWDDQTHLPYTEALTVTPAGVLGWAPNYATLEEIKQISSIEDDADDLVLGAALAGASRAIDLAANRQFGLVPSAEARTYLASWDKDRGWVVEIDDLMISDGLIVADSSTTYVLDDDFKLVPYNAAAKGVPWRELVFTGGLIGACHPYGRQPEITVTARYGWTAVPDAIKQACILQTFRFFKRKDAPFGVAGSPDMGSEMRLLSQIDPDVAVLVAPYRRYWAAA